MEADIAKAINYILDWFNAIPGHNWYALGVTLASVPVVIGILEWIKSHHFKVKAVELENHFIAINLVVWSTVMTVADFILTNGSSFGTFLPYLNDHMPQLLAASTTAYTFAKAAKNWFANRDKETQAERFKAVTEGLDKLPTLPDFRPLSNGTAANNITVEKPDSSQNLIQL